MLGAEAMIEIAQVLLFDRDNRLMIYLRDDKADIPFPNHWDFFGGHVEQGETPEQALLREVKEELGTELVEWQFFRSYECVEGDVTRTENLFTGLESTKPLTN